MQQFKHYEDDFENFDFSEPFDWADVSSDDDTFYDPSLHETIVTLIDDSDCHEIYGYKQLVQHMEIRGRFSDAYPFLLFTGSFQSVDFYLNQLRGVSEFSPKFFLSLIIVYENELARENFQGPNDPFLNHWAENTFVEVFEERNWGADDIELLFSYLEENETLLFLMNEEKQVEMSEAHVSGAVNLGEHMKYTPYGSLQFSPEYVEGKSPEDIRYKPAKDLPKDGQRKLFCDLVDTIQSIPALETVIYIGAYPGHGTDVAAEARPDLQFYFSDLQLPVDNQVNKSYYSDNVKWFKNIGEINYDPGTTLFYSDIFRAEKMKEMFMEQVEYSKAFGCKYNSIKRLIPFREMVSQRVSDSRLYHEVWGGSGGHLRERYKLGGVSHIGSLDCKLYERHISWYDGTVRQSGANIKSKWTKCRCHDCKVFQGCLDTALIWARESGKENEFLNKVRRLKTRVPYINIITERSDTDSLGERIEGEINGKTWEEKLIPSKMVVLLDCLTGQEETYLTPKMVVAAGNVYYDLNGEYERKKVEDPVIPFPMRFVLMDEGEETTMTFQYRLISVANTRDFEEVLRQSPVKGIS